MSQMLSNLMGNAVQHGDVKSPVSVMARRDENGDLELSVHNEGTPIPLKMIPKLFDGLFQGSSDQRAADDNSTSLGLGLYIAKEIIAAHGGTIQAQSSDGAGTSFIVRLPNMGIK
jgi:signal transduction histidine kinase